MNTNTKTEHSSFFEELDTSAQCHGSWACSKCGSCLPRPLAVSIKEFCRITSLCRTSAWSLARENKIEVRHVGSRVLVLTRSIDTLLGLSEQDGQ